MLHWLNPSTQPQKTPLLDRSLQKQRSRRLSITSAQLYCPLPCSSCPIPTSHITCTLMKKGAKPLEPSYSLWALKCCQWHISPNNRRHHPGMVPLPMRPGSSSFSIRRCKKLILDQPLTIFSPHHLADLLASKFLSDLSDSRLQQFTITKTPLPPASE